MSEKKPKRERRNNEIIDTEIVPLHSPDRRAELVGRLFDFVVISKRVCAIRLLGVLEREMKNHLFIASVCITFTSIMHAESFDSFEQAFVAPEKATTLSITKYDPAIKHLPSQLGTLTNLVELDISCLENLEDLPSEIGNLKKLEKLIIDNGNGCGMNISLPESIGNLSNLKVLRLYGALDPTDLSDTNKPIPPSEVKSLPGTIGKLQNLEELDLGRNRIKRIPSQIASLQKLKR